MPTATLAPASVLALAACHAARKLDDCREDVAPGAYKNVTVTVIATVAGDTATATVTAAEIVVGTDEEYIPTVEIPQLATLALALKKAGVQRENIKAVLVEAATEALQKGEKVSDALELAEDLEDAFRQVRATMARLPKKTRAGKVLLKKAKASRFTTHTLTPVRD
jgi:hypothetical protein